MDSSKLDVTMTQIYIDALDRLVEKGLYLDRTNIIREALRGLLRKHGIEPFNTGVAEKNEKNSD